MDATTDGLSYLRPLKLALPPDVSALNNDHRYQANHILKVTWAGSLRQASSWSNPVFWNVRKLLTPQCGSWH
jgi:hypothetical protein